jgi:hypothetical protein
VKSPFLPNEPIFKTAKPPRSQFACRTESNPISLWRGLR